MSRFSWPKYSPSLIPAKVAAFYTEDATFNPPNEPPVRGRAAIQAWMQKMYDQGSASLTLTPVESAISGNIAYSYESYTFTFTPKGAPPVVEKGKSVVVYKQVGGKWLLAHDIFNSDTPPPPAPPAKAAAPAKPAPRLSRAARAAAACRR